MAPELIAELGEPYGVLWDALCERYSERIASRVLAALIGLRSEHGDELVRSHIESLLSPAGPVEQAPSVDAHVSIPDRMAAVQIHSGVAADYDLLLLTGGAG